MKQSVSRDVRGVVVMDMYDSAWRGGVEAKGTEVVVYVMEVECRARSGAQMEVEQ